jgi:hypothetical protein
VQGVSEIMISEKTTRKIDYWTEIETAAKNGTGAPEHDCGREGCQVCADYYESRKWWVEQKSNLNNKPLF